MTPVRWQGGTWLVWYLLNCDRSSLKLYTCEREREDRGEGGRKEEREGGKREGRKEGGEERGRGGRKEGGEERKRKVDQQAPLF